MRSSPVKPRMSIALWKQVGADVSTMWAVMEEKGNVTHISGHQFFTVVNTGHTDLSLAYEWVVVGVSGDEQSLWKENNNTSLVIKMHIV